MTLLKSVFAVVAPLVVIACGSEVLAPTPTALTGTWLTAAEPLQPNGSFTRKLVFLPSGHYVSTVESRGVYGGVPRDSVVSYSSEYGTYTLTGDILRLVQDSAKGWDLLGGSWNRVGPPGIYIEGPPTDPVVEVSQSRLVLRYEVNPGAGYVPVKAIYYRAR